MVTRDLQDLQHVLGHAEDRGLLTPDASRELYTTAARSAVMPSDTSRLMFSLAVPDPAEWRDLARKSVPWAQWTKDQKVRAADERTAAWNRLLKGDYSQKAADDETLKLLEPYRSDMRDFAAKTVRAVLSVSPFMTAAEGTPVTLSVDVILPSARRGET